MVNPQLSIRLMKEKRDINGLIDVLAHKNKEEQLSAIRALGELCDPQAVGPLIEQLGDSDAIIKKHAVQALGNIADAKALEAIAPLLEDEDYRLRAYAAEALRKIGDPKALAFLLDASVCDSDFVRDEAFLAIVRIGSSAVEPLIEILESSHDQMAEIAATLLGRIGDSRAVCFSYTEIPENKKQNSLKRASGFPGKKVGQLNGCPPTASLCLGIHTEAEEEGSVLNMSQIDVIREMARKGCRLTEITRATGHDPKTVRKYLEMDDFSPRPPLKRTCVSKLDPYKAQIDAWLAEDKRTWRKQHHTAQRIHDRLVKEIPGYDCSYSLVQRYVKAERQASGARGSLELIWHPGEAQADFGEQLPGSVHLPTSSSL